MSTKLSKDEVKSPDQVTKTLKQGFKWTQAHSKVVIAGLAIFVVVGLGSSIYGGLSEKKELAAQDVYAQFEKTYLDKKRDFDEADRESTRPNPSKDAKTPVKAKATGDLEKDFGSEVAAFKKIMDDYAGTKAAQMAALNLSEIYIDYKKNDEALQALQKVESQSKNNDLVSSVVLSQYGNVLSDKGDCKGALDKWNKVLATKEAAFLHDSLLLKSGICYEKISEFSKAEEVYKKLSQSPKDPQMGDTGFAKDAEKYLRLLNLKKQSDTKGS